MHSQTKSELQYIAHVACITVTWPGEFNSSALVGLAEVIATLYDGKITWRHCKRKSTPRRQLVPTIEEYHM